MGKPVPGQVKRRLQIQTLLQLGWSVDRISKQAGCARRTVLTWKRRFAEGSSEQDRPRSGRPRKLTPTLCKQLKKHVSGHRGRSTRKSSAWLRTQKGVSVSRWTVGRALTEENL